MDLLGLSPEPPMLPGDYVLSMDLRSGLYLAHRVEASATFAAYYGRVIASQEPMTFLGFIRMPANGGDAR